MSRRLPLVLRHPEQGWSSLALLLGMLVLLGISVADSRPLTVVGAGSLTDSLPPLMLAAGLISYLLARSSLGVVRAHVIGAAVAAVVLLLVAGGGLGGQSPLPVALDGLTDRIGAVWTRLDADIDDLVTADRPTPTVTTFLVLGAICWTTAQFGAFSVFRYDRGGPAVMAVGTILFLNIGLGSLQAEAELLPVVPVLALFAGMALLLLMRLQLVQQRYAWARRHISDAQEVSRLFMRTGVAFVLVAVVGASSLTVWATVEAQEVDIDGLEEPLEDLADEVSRVLSVFGVITPVDVPRALGTRTDLASTWTPGTGVAFTAVIEEGQLRDNYWWGKADDRYDYRNDAWVTTGDRTGEVEANDQLWPGSDAAAGGSHRAQVSLVVGDSPARRNLFRLPDVNEIDTHDVIVRYTDGGGVSDMEFTETLREGDTVTFVSFVRDYSEGSRTLTANDLRAAGTEYPPWVRDRYLQGRGNPDIVGPRTQAMADRIRSSETTPYDQALAVQNELRAMEYVVSLGADCEPFEAFPECLLTIRKGFCQQYATTMVMVMRAMDVPARFVTGYLPGDRDEDGVWTVEQQALHNWAEVYFPDIGWVRFDPTPGTVGFGSVGTNPDDGDDPRARPTPPAGPDEPDASFAPEEPDDAFVPPPLDPPEARIDGNSRAIFIGTAGLVAMLVTLVSVFLLFRLRRLPGGDDSLAYRGVVSLATRLGLGPHPSQTEYEYAGTLSEALPHVRDDLYLVTDARVGSAYGKRSLDTERRGTLRSAYARIRTALLRLALRGRR
jgi:transglutaminase-like putative cysteine protease